MRKSKKKVEEKKIDAKKTTRELVLDKAKTVSSIFKKIEKCKSHIIDIENEIKRYKKTDPFYYKGMHVKRSIYIDLLDYLDVGCDIEQIAKYLNGFFKKRIDELEHELALIEVESLDKIKNDTKAKTNTPER